jgi:hypothetical protein
MKTSHVIIGIAGVGTLAYLIWKNQKQTDQIILPLPAAKNTEPTATVKVVPSQNIVNVLPVTKVTPVEVAQPIYVATTTITPQPVYTKPPIVKQLPTLVSGFNGFNSTILN